MIGTALSLKRIDGVPINFCGILMHHVLASARIDVEGAHIIDHQPYSLFVIPPESSEFSVADFIVRKGEKEFFPKSPAEELGGLDGGIYRVPLWSPAAPWTTYSSLIQVKSGALVQDPVTLNWSKAETGVSELVTFRLGASSDPKVASFPGVDLQTQVLIGRWGSLGIPSLQPEGIEWGQDLDVVLPNGHTGKLRLLQRLPENSIEMSNLYGEKFLCQWRNVR